MATQELHLDLQDLDYLGTQASCPDIKNFHVCVCSENNDCINPGDLSGRSGRDKYGVPRNQTGNLSVKVKEEEDVRSDIPQAGVTGNSSMTNKSDSEGNLNAKSDTNSDFQTKSELVGVNLGHESMMKVYEHISRFSHQKASDFEFKIDGGETSESIPWCVDDGFGIQNGKCMDVFNVKVKEEADVTDNKGNVVECAVHNKTLKENNPCKCVNVKTDFTLVERETGVRQDVHGNQSVIANSHSIACRKADASAPKLLIRKNPSEDKCNTRNDACSDTCSRQWKENLQIFPIALNQIRIKLPITEEIQQQLHQECLQEQREGNRTVGGEMEQKKGNQTHGGKMDEENEIKSQSYMYGYQRKSHRNKVLRQEKRPPYACRQCDKVFLTYGGRSRHEELHLALTFKCDMCSSTFKKQNYLRDHIKRIHRQKDLECKICGKVYGYKKALKLHMSTCILRKQATKVHSFEQGKTFGARLWSQLASAERPYKENP
ncbi:PR domain zinc finger protein 5-like [Ptychodera flava]|uniref:PR domain zinc finger protein 5-like n=1 Tax=Ptychodera flava TaxID=63121 RepID=UPI003969DB64